MGQHADDGRDGADQKQNVARCPKQQKYGYANGKTRHRVDKVKTPCIEKPEPRDAVMHSMETPQPRPLVGKTMFPVRSEEHTSELQSLMRISYADFCLQK